MLRGDHRSLTEREGIGAVARQGWALDLGRKGHGPLGVDDHPVAAGAVGRARRTDADGLALESAFGVEPVGAHLECAVVEVTLHAGGLALRRGVVAVRGDVGRVVAGAAGGVQGDVLGPRDPLPGRVERGEERVDGVDGLGPGWRRGPRGGQGE